MTRILSLAAVLAAAALPGMAQDTGMTAVADTDGDGAYSMEEVRAGYPSLTEDQFAAADADGNGLLSEEEFRDAAEAGVFGM